MDDDPLAEKPRTFIN